MSDHDAFRDGKVHVLDDKCSTCIFRSKNLMHLEPGRVKEMVESAVEEDSAIICHQTLHINPSYESDGEAVCRGFYDSYADRTLALRLAKMCEIVEEQEQSKKVDSHEED